MKKQEPKQQPLRDFICDYGSRHAFNGPHSFANCRCANRFGNKPVTFFRYMMYKFGVQNKAQITAGMQINYLSRTPQGISAYLAKFKKTADSETTKESSVNNLLPPSIARSS